MEEMKFVENPNTNHEVVKIVETLKEEILPNFHPKSIILSGSFGKGEVMVIENGGYIQFLSDCEVIIIPNKHVFNQDKIKKFSESFFERVGLKVSISGVILSVYLLFPFLNRNLKPTIENYDLKYGSKVIYGKNYLDRVPNFKPEDIPLWEGIRLLFNRMAESLEHFSLENPSEEMVFWTDKIVLACQDALLLSLGKYHHLYRKRNGMFQNLFPEHFNELKDEVQNFLGLTVEATERKFNGTMNVNDPIKYWFDTAEICDQVFRYVIKKGRGIEFKDYLEFQEKYMERQNIKKKCYDWFVPYPSCQNLVVVIKTMFVSNEIISPKIITKIRTPWKHIIYSSVPPIYFCISRNGEINKSYLKRVRENLSWFKELKEPTHNLSDEYEYLKEHLIGLWYRVCY